MDAMTPDPLVPQGFTPDVITADQHDWRGMDLAHVYWKAKAGIPEARAEMRRRGHKPPESSRG